MKKEKISEMKTNMVDVRDLAKYLLFLFKEEADEQGVEASDVTPLKLQKLLYYCQGYALALTGKPLFGDEIEAWRFGPVVPVIYKQYKDLKDYCVPLADITEKPHIGAVAEGIARIVKLDKGIYSAAALVNMTHSENPWKDIYLAPYHNETITNEALLSYFGPKLTDEGSEEDEIWNAAGEPLTSEDWEGLLNRAI